MKQLFPLICLLGLMVPSHAATPDYAGNIASLISPIKLATLGERAANPRIQKCVYWLEQARQNGLNTTNTVRQAVARAGYRDAAADLTEEALLRNLDIATKLGCLDPAGLSKMRQGEAPTVRKGPYAGDIASVDHIIPRSVVPELDCVIANLELLPLKLNLRKNSTVGSRQVDLAEKLHKAGLLSQSGLERLQVPLCWHSHPSESLEHHHASQY